MDQAAIDEWQSAVRKKFGKEVMVNHSGLTWKDIGKSATESGLIQIWQMTRAEQASVLGVPLALIGIVDQVKYNSAPEQTKVFWTSLVPTDLEMQLQDINQLLLPHFGPEFVARYDLASMQAVQDIELEKTEKMGTAVSHGAMSRSEEHTSELQSR